MSGNCNNSTSPQPWRTGSSGSTTGTGTKSKEGSASTSDRPPGPPYNPPPRHLHQQHQRERLDRDREKNHETVCNLLSMLTLGMDQHDDPASTSRGGGASSAADHNRMLLLNLTNSPESCIALRRAGCIPLLIEILHPPSTSMSGMRPPPEIIKTRAARALKNIVQFNPDDKLKRKELRVLKLLEGIRAFSEAVRMALQALEKETATSQKSKGSVTFQDVTRGEDREAEHGAPDKEKLQSQQHPTSSMTTLMKLSFDEEHRNIMCLLGAIHALADLIVCDHLIHGNSPQEIKDDCLLIRRYSGMTLINLTFGDGTNKALLCGMGDFMRALVSQLECENEDVCQVTASILRNLSWHADSSSRAALRDSNAVTKLTLAAVRSTKESTLKATLSALWNLSAHSVPNKAAICMASQESLSFLISLLRPNNPILKAMKTPMTIIENAGGILRNISSQISSSPELRKVLRENHCYEILLEHLKSCSLTVVSNACGTLWNISGGVGCEEDQRKLLDLNAVPMLKNLIYSKHERISQGASAALRNLLSSRFAKEHMLQLDSRLTAQIYSPNLGNTAERGGCADSNQESPGSEGDLEFEFNENMHIHQHPQTQFQQQLQHQVIHHHPPMVQNEPPVAHQHSSAAAASIFQRVHPQPSHPVPTHFHAVPNFAHPGNYMSRPTSINYSMEPEPLDLTLTSAKSSPIHIISAAEFGGMTGHHQHNIHHSHHRKPKSAPYSHAAQYHGSQKPFYNPPAMLHQTASSQCNSPVRFNYPSAKFNQSCPEILSRLSTGHQSISSFAGEQKPLDFSSNSPSASSSLRGAGEASGVHGDSVNGGDTTFNYSLQFTEVDEDDRVNTTGNGENTSKSEDTLKTYCYEGTPHNFSISNSCQDLVQEVEFEKATEAASTSEKTSQTTTTGKSPKLQPIDEAPKAYYVENTPAVFSRTSSLSSINSSGGLNAGENRADPIITDSQPEGSSGDKKSELGDDLPQQHPVPAKRKTISHGTFTPGRLTFSAEETPLMFSRCSSVASLDSLEVGVVGSGGGGNGLATHNDDDLSDFSRRASEVVSPSDLPDSPRAMAPPVRLYDQPSLSHDKISSSQAKQVGDDDLKVFSMEEKSGLNSCRSLSPLMIDGEVLPVLGKKHLDAAEILPEKVDSSQNENGYLGQKQSSDTGDGSAAIASKLDDEPEVPKKKGTGFPDDEVKVFAMEGTPFYGVSNATSLSDLTMDIDNNEPKLEAPQKQIQPRSNLLADKTPSGMTEDAQTTSNLQPMPSETKVKPEEPVYSDVQLLQKCIRIGKAAGIPKSKSEYKITSGPLDQPLLSTVSGSSSNLTGSKNSSHKPLVESKSQQNFDDPDLAALIMKGRNRPKEKERTSTKANKISKTPTTKPDPNNKPASKSSSSESDSTSKSATYPSNPAPGVNAELDKSGNNLQETDKPTNTEEKQSDSSEPNSSEDSNGKVGDTLAKICKTGLKIETPQLDPSQISTTSLGSEWNDETPTFSSPIPSMSISTAFKIVGGVDDSSCSKLVPVTQANITAANPVTTSMQSSILTMSINNELLDNMDPPSTFSNLVSSSDCIVVGSPPLHHRMQGSTSDKLNRKWKALNDPANTSSVYSNLSGQRPPLDLDLENSMISVASIKSEIYELSSTASFTNDVFQSAVEDIESPVAERFPGDTSIGGNTYTIFPPENVQADNGKSTDVVSEGGNTVVSDDFTDAEEIEDYETAPADDIEPVLVREKRDSEKIIPEKSEDVISHPKKEEDNLGIHKNNAESPPRFQHAYSNQAKPLMEVHPLELENKYSTFRVSRSPIPNSQQRSSPKQKRKDDPERYKTRTIAALHTAKNAVLSTNDSNGNPLDESRFATFRVGGPKILKPAENANNGTATNRSSGNNSPESTPGNSPKGIRGRRRPLYSSLPPAAIASRKKSAAPPIPPKPTRNASPVRPPSGGSGGVYVRPTRTSELRIAANSRDNSPGRMGSNSRNSSSSSLNLIHGGGHYRQSDQESIVSASARPKIAPKPPIRTSVSVSSSPGNVKPFSGSTYNVLIKTSNSSFGFGQQKVADGSFPQNMKGYSTLPKSSKLGGEFAGMYMPGSVVDAQSGESKESIPGIEKSQGKIGKLTNLFKRMDFHRNSKEVHDSSQGLPQMEYKQTPKSDIFSNVGQEKKPSKFTSFFGRKKDKDKSQPKPFLDSSAGNNSVVAPGNIASIRGASGIWVRRDGENKAMVAPFNYVPPPGHSIGSGQIKDQSSGTTSVNGNTNGNESNENTIQVSNTSAAGSAKITTV